MLTLVTGATGLVGNNVVRMLLGRGERVRVLAREGCDPRPLEHLDVEIAIGDLRDDDAVQRAVDGVDRVVHAAGYVHIGWSRLDLHCAVNVEGTRSVARAARDAGVRMVHVSSCDTVGIRAHDLPVDEETQTQGDVLIPYVVTKREAEQVIAEEVAAGLDAVIVNPGFMLGPWDWKPSSGLMLLEVARGKGWLAPRGCSSFCDVRDVAAGALAAAEWGQTGRRYLLAGETMTYLDAWRLFAEVTGARRPLGNVGPVFSFLAGRAGDLWGWISQREPNVNSGALKIAKLPKDYSSQRAVTELGYTMRPPRESVEDAWAWFKEHGYA
jgi:dihydroflavonol-4-reductase